MKIANPFERFSISSADYDGNENWEFITWNNDALKNIVVLSNADWGSDYLDELIEILAIVGLSHIVVASGTHLGIIVGSGKKLFSKIFSVILKIPSREISIPFSVPHAT